MKPRPVFIDTSGWAAYFRAEEIFHMMAFRYLSDWRKNGRKMITTNHVVAELVALLTARGTRRTDLFPIVETLRSADWLEIVHADRSLEADAYALLLNRSDKMWSLVDCLSFVVLEQRGLTEALTTDKHFEQAGFVRLLAITGNAELAP